MAPMMAAKEDEDDYSVTPAQLKILQEGAKKLATPVT